MRKSVLVPMLLLTSLSLVSCSNKEKNELAILKSSVDVLNSRVSVLEGDLKMIKEQNNPTQNPLNQMDPNGQSQDPNQAANQATSNQVGGETSSASASGYVALGTGISSDSLNVKVTRARDMSEIETKNDKYTANGKFVNVMLEVANKTGSAASLKDMNFQAVLSYGGNEYSPFIDVEIPVASYYKNEVGGNHRYVDDALNPGVFYNIPVVFQTPESATGTGAIIFYINGEEIGGSKLQ